MRAFITGLLFIVAAVCALPTSTHTDERTPKDAAICKQYHWLMNHIYHERINDMERFCTEGGER